MTHTQCDSTLIGTRRRTPRGEPLNQAEKVRLRTQIAEPASNANVRLILQTAVLQILLGYAIILGCSRCQRWHPLIGQAPFHLSKRNTEAVKSSTQTVGVFGGSVVAGGLEAASAGGAGGWSSAGGTVGLGAGRWVFLRFTVFLLTSFLSSWATFHLPTNYRKLQVWL